MGRGGGAALPTATRGAVVLMVVNISMIALLTAVAVASCTGSNRGCAGLLPRCHDEERRALLQMKKYSSSVLGDWGGVAGGDDCCQWRGITCSNHTGRVIRIDLLRMLDISHPDLASTLVQLKELESLDLEWSTISGTLLNVLLCNFKHLKQLRLIYGSIVNSSSWTIPSCLGNLHNLERLDLSGNEISGTIPEGLCNIRTLKDLDIFGNRINGTIPSCLGNLHNLESLDLSFNEISGTIPEGLCNMRTLKGLHVTGSRINGTIPSCLGNLHNLETLHLSGNKISGTIPEGLCNIRTLKGLDISYNGITGTIPSCLGNLHNLETLALSGNKISGTIPEGLCNLRHLKQLALLGNRLNGSIPSCLGNLHNLEMLRLWGNEFQGSIPPSIFPNLTKLTSVFIGGGRLEGTFSFSAFANLSNLEVIDIRSSEYGLLEIEIVESPSWVPSFQLRILSIYGCSVVNKGNGGGGGGSSRFPARFISTQTKLQFLYLVNNRMTGTFQLAPSCNASRDLSHIDLSHNLLHGSLPTDVGLSFPNLHYLFMAGNQLEGTIPPSLGQARHLRVLDLSDNQLSGELPHTLTRNQTTLMYLNVSYNQLVGEILPKDTYNMPGLKFLLLHHNSFTGSIPSLVSNFSNLRALDVGHNHLECSLSHCLPSNVPSMIALSLRNNHLHGHLPTHHLCQMQHLHLLDLSGNNLTGKIPPCLTNISFWRSGKGTDNNNNDDRWIYSTDDIMGFASKNLLLPYQGVPLNLMTVLDMSSNRLDGAIPWEIGQLKGLRSLNLSNNGLEGSLPRSMGNMESLESLDVSRNNLNGSIPHEMVQLNFLSTLCVAFNHLSGEIPSQGQFSTFSTSDFQGNPELCGAPLERNCSPDDPTRSGAAGQKEADIGEGSSLWDNTILFYAWLVLSFAVGFWGVIATMVLNRRWRIKFFRVVDDFLDRYLRRY